MTDQELHERFEGLHAQVRVEIETTADALRLETRALGEELRAETRALGQELRAEMKAQGEELRAEMKAQGEELRAEMKAQGEELRAEMKTQREELVALIKDEGAQTRRHFDVVAEGIEFKFRIVAEGYDALRQDVNELKLGQARLETRIEGLDLRLLAVETRIGAQGTAAAS